MRNAISKQTCKQRSRQEKELNNLFHRSGYKVSPWFLRYGEKGRYSNNFEAFEKRVDKVVKSKAFIEWLEQCREKRRRLLLLPKHGKISFVQN